MSFVSSSRRCRGHGKRQSASLAGDQLPAARRARFFRAAARFRQVRQRQPTQSANDLGKALEDLVAALFSADERFVVKSVRHSTGDEEIDLVVAINCLSAFWLSLRSPLLLIECKNWTKPVGAREVRDLAGKLANHRVLASVGFLVAGKTFSSQALEALRRMSRDDVLVVPLTANDILAFTKRDEQLTNWLEDRMAHLI